MIIIGCDYHPGFQQIAYVDTETGELQERALQHREDAEKFYRELAAQGMKVRVGMEASGHARWFERLLAELNFELWIGDAAEIRTKRVGKQKTDRQDAQLILKLMLKDDFPRIWVCAWLLLFIFIFKIELMGLYTALAARSGVHLAGRKLRSASCSLDIDWVRYRPGLLAPRFHLRRRTAVSTS